MEDTSDQTNFNNEEENIPSGNGISDGIKPEKLANLVIGIIFPLIESESEKRKFEQEFKMRSIPALEFIEVEELTEGMSAKELPDWLRWGIFAGALSIPAFAGMKKYTSVLDKPKKSKRKKQREKDKKEKEKQENQGKEE